MNRLFAFDFRQVRIFRWPQASGAAVIRTDIFFGDGCYQPQTEDGRKLLAHELAHVVQQREGGDKRWISNPADEWETAAWGRSFLEPAPVGIYFGSIPRIRPRVSWDDLANRVDRIESNRLAMAYRVLQLENVQDTANFRRSAAVSLSNRINALYLPVLQRILALGNTGIGSALFSRANTQMQSYMSGAQVPPGVLFWPAAAARPTGPVITAGNGGGRLASQRELQIARGEPLGDPNASSLSDFLGRSPAIQTLDAIRTAGPTGAFGAIIAEISGQDEAGIQAAIAAGSLLDVAASGGLARPRGIGRGGTPIPQNLQGTGGQDPFGPSSAHQDNQAAIHSSAGRDAARQRQLLTNGALRRWYTREDFGLGD